MTRPDPQPHTAYLLTALGHEVIDNARDEITMCWPVADGWVVWEAGTLWSADDYGRKVREDEWRTSQL